MIEQRYGRWTTTLSLGLLAIAIPAFLIAVIVVSVAATVAILSQAFSWSAPNAVLVSLAALMLAVALITVALLRITARLRSRIENLAELSSRRSKLTDKITDFTMKDVLHLAQSVERIEERLDRLGGHQKADTD